MRSWSPLEGPLAREPKSGPGEGINAWPASRCSQDSPMIAPRCAQDDRKQAPIRAQEDKASQKSITGQCLIRLLPMDF
eukprot:2442289-Pyramimonas_sp.AAC.1